MLFRSSCFFYQRVAYIAQDLDDIFIVAPSEVRKTLFSRVQSNSATSLIKRAASTKAFGSKLLLSSLQTQFEVPVFQEDYNRRIQQRLVEQYTPLKNTIARPTQSNYSRIEDPVNNFISHLFGPVRNAYDGQGVREAPFDDPTFMAGREGPEDLEVTVTLPLSDEDKAYQRWYAENYKAELD